MLVSFEQPIRSALLRLCLLGDSSAPACACSALENPTRNDQSYSMPFRNGKDALEQSSKFRCLLVLSKEAPTRCFLGSCACDLQQASIALPTA